MKESKTNAMRILDREGISYKKHMYDHTDGFIDGVSVSKKMGLPVEQVYKTLVTQGASRDYHVFVIPVAKELDLKAAARAVGEKSVEMIKVSEINKVTGYIRGGCSPIGMKKNYDTVLDSSCESLPAIFVSAGKIGYQVELSPDDLKKAVKCRTADVAIEN